jgi:drug/metabolite transporter superfamily protein YnfA
MGILILVGLIFVALLFLQGGVWLSEKVLPWLLRVAEVTLAVVVLVLLPLAAAWRTRRFAAKGMLYASGVFGITLWVWGLTLTYNLWGGVAVLIGLICPPSAKVGHG